MLAARDMDAAPCYFKQEQAFVSTLPLLALEGASGTKRRAGIC